MSDRIGEVIEASTAHFLAQAYELYQAPPFGSLVETQAGEVEIYAIASNAATTSIDPGRQPIARGRELEDEAQIFRENPQLTQLLHTTFEALVVGYRSEAKIHHYLPPSPARVHSFVYLCGEEELRAFTHSFDFLSLLLGYRLASPVDELAAAFLRQAALAWGGDRDFLVRAGKELTLFLGREPQRLEAILRRIRHDGG